MATHFQIAGAAGEVIGPGNQRGRPLGHDLPWLVAAISWPSMVYLSQRLGNKTQNPMVNHKWFPLKHIQQHIWDVLHLWTKPFVYPSNSRYSTFFRFSKDRICQWGRDKWSQLLGQYFDNPNWWFLMKPLQLVGKSWQVTTIASAAGFVWKYTWKSNGIMFIFWFKRIIWVFFQYTDVHRDSYPAAIHKNCALRLQSMLKPMLKFSWPFADVLRMPRLSPSHTVPRQLTMLTDTRSCTIKVYLGFTAWHSSTALVAAKQRNFDMCHFRFQTYPPEPSCVFVIICGDIIYIICSLWYFNTLCCWFGHDISKDCRPSWTLIASWCWHRFHHGSVMISG